MELTVQQKDEVAAWFAAGASLDEIQKRVKAEFGVHMTYLDVRLMVAELPQPAETGEGEVGGEGAKTPRTEPQDDDRDFADGLDNRRGSNRDFADGTDSRQGSNGTDNRQGEACEVEGAPLPEDGEDADSAETQTVSAPTVTIDALMIPGTIASGDVTFSDGQTGKWFLDQMGRLGLGGDLPQGYRPSPTDAALFQQQLMQQLQSKGLC